MFRCPPLRSFDPYFWSLQRPTLLPADLADDRLHLHRVSLGEVDPEPVRAVAPRHGRQALVAALGRGRHSHRPLSHDAQQLDKLLYLLREALQLHTQGEMETKKRSADGMAPHIVTQVQGYSSGHGRTFVDIKLGIAF